MSEPMKTVRLCSTCSKSLDPDLTDDLLRASQLSAIAQQYYLNPQIMSSGAYRRPITVQFLHVFANVKCPECNETARIEIRL